MINLVDQYVIYDDVNFIKGGWINRNRILSNGNVRYINVPMIGASSNKLINQIEVNQEEHFKRKNLEVIQSSYKKAKYFDEVFPIIKEIILCNEKNLALYNYFSIKCTCDYLGIRTPILLSSSLEKEKGYKGQEKVIRICEGLNGTTYFNAIGGIKLYSYSKFKESGISLKFLRTDKIEYEQFNNVFYENLSILDVMMFNSKEEIFRLLNKYSIISEGEKICTKE